MNAIGRRFRGLWARQILHPQVSEEELHARLSEVRRHLPVPVIWLLGKTQSGKTSIIRTLTGSSGAEIGNGFQACTRFASFFDFPDSQTAFVRFLDTRGLAEVDYQPEEDIRWCEQQAHLVIVAVKAMDHQLDCIVKAVREVHKQRPEWPVIVAQTTLHEGYVDKAMDHVLPYPFDAEPFAAGVPSDVARSLLKQRELFDGLGAYFVALDFTLPEDGYKPLDYGGESLWQAIEETLPLGLRGLLEQSEQRSRLNDCYARQSHPHIISYSLAAGVAAAIPAPVAGLGIAAAFQAKLFHSIASIYGVTLTPKSVTEVIGAVGLGMLAGMGSRELAKLVPGYGQTAALGVAGLYTAAVTYALGRVFCFYFAGTLRGHAFSAEVLRGLYREEFKHGRALLAETLKRTEG